MGLRNESVAERWLNVDEIRVIADLRIMHSKVSELQSIIKMLQSRYDVSNVVEYSDAVILSENIARMHEVYLLYLEQKKRHYRIR